MVLDWVIQGIINADYGKDRRQKKCLIDREVTGLFAKIKMAGIADAVLPVVEVGGIDIQLEDLIFRQMLFKVCGTGQLEEFPFQPLFKGEIKIFHKLLRDRASPVAQIAVEDTPQGVADDIGLIAALVVIKLAVFQIYYKEKELPRNIPQRAEIRQRRPGFVDRLRCLFRSFHRCSPRLRCLCSVAAVFSITAFRG